MLKILLLIALVAATLFLLACLGLALLMMFIIFTTPKDELAARPREAPQEAPPLDEALFNRLVREAMAYATRPYVTTIVDASGIVLLSTVSDAFGRRVYAESRRRDGKTLNAVICVYENGSHTPARSEEHTSELQSQSNLVCRLLL